MMRWIEFIFQKAERHPFIVATALALFMLLIPVFLRPIHTPDEGRYAEVTRDMLENRSWLVPHLNGYPHLTKPPLFYDIAAVFFTLFGVKLFAIRLVSLASFLAALYFCIGWAGRRAGQRAAALSGLIGATLIPSAVAAEFADLNMLLTLWLVLGLLFFFDALEKPDHLYSWYWAWGLLGMGFMTKGPPALIIPSGTVFLYRLFSGRKFAVPFRKWILGIALYCLIAFPWYIWTLHREGDKLVNFWVGQIFRRTVAGPGAATRLPGYYLILFLFGSMGWSFLAVYKLCQHLRTKWRLNASQIQGKSFLSHGVRIFKILLQDMRTLSQDELWLVCWIVATIVPFSIALSQMPSYILPCFPAFGLVLALHFSRKNYREGEEKILHKTFFVSMMIIVISLWGWSFYGFYMVRTPCLNVPRFIQKHLEPAWIDYQFRPLRGRPFVMIQYSCFYPTFNFENRRYSVLVKESIYPQWQYDPALSISEAKLTQWVEENRPIAIILESRHIKDFQDERWKNLIVYFQGERYSLLVTPAVGLDKPH